MLLYPLLKTQEVFSQDLVKMLKIKHSRKQSRKRNLAYRRTIRVLNDLKANGQLSEQEYIAALQGVATRYTRDTVQEGFRRLKDRAIAQAQAVAR